MLWSLRASSIPNSGSDVPVELRRRFSGCFFGTFFPPLVPHGGRGTGEDEPRQNRSRSLEDSERQGDRTASTRSLILQPLQDVKHPGLPRQRRRQGAPLSRTPPSPPPACPGLCIPDGTSAFPFPPLRRPSGSTAFPFFPNKSNILSGAARSLNSLLE